MLKTTTEKIKPLVKDDAVSEFDRGGLTAEMFLGSFWKLKKNGMYRLEKVHGIVSTMFSRNQLIKANFVIVQPDKV